jgi:hypothetical protein
MSVQRVHFATIVSVAYFVLVALVFVWYETSLGVSDNGGLIPGLVLTLLTVPSVFLSGWASSLFGCALYSMCEHVVVYLFAGALNALLIFAILRLISLIWSKKNAP